MENRQIKVIRNRRRRSLSVRKTLRGTAERPRLCVMKTNTHIHVQLINDEISHTLASCSTCSAEFRATEFNRRNKGSARQLGLKIAELAQKQEVKKVVFDRGPFKYHGVLAALADGAREGGLEF